MTKLRTLLLCSLMTPLLAAAQTRIAVLTDTHVMAPELLVSDGTAWQSYLASDRKLVDYSQQLFDLVTDRIKNEIRPDLLLITGDLSKDGEIASHNYVAGKLASLKATGIPTLVIPGNHDLGTSNAKVYNGDNATNAEVATASSFASIYADFGYGSTSERDPNSLSYVCQPISGLTIIGIDSGKNGVVSSETLSWVCNHARAAVETGQQVIAMMHHQLIPHFSNIEMFVSYAVVNDYETIRNALADAGVRVILTGHFHTSDIAKDFNANLSESIIDINTGSLISYPCDYRMLTLSEDKSSLTVNTYSISELTPGDGFSDVSKNRLKDAVEKQVKSRGAAYKMIAPTVSTAFIYHAEGDEHQSSGAQTTLTQLLSAANMAKMMGVMTADQAAPMENMANSMLRDISQYGVSGRQNQTDDRSITIPLDPVTQAVTVPACGFVSLCSPKRIDMSLSSGLNAYIVRSSTASEVTLEKIGIIPAGEGVIIQGTPGSYNLHATSKTPESYTQLLHGVNSPVAAPSGAYVLSIKNGTVGFYPVAPGITIPKGKAYLTR